MTVNQGDIYWVSLNKSNDLEPGYVHPHVVIQEDAIKTIAAPIP